MRHSLKKQKNQKKQKIVFLSFVMLVLLETLFFSTAANAMLPVVDAGAIGNLVKNYMQLEKQYTLLQNTYQNEQQELNQTKALTNDAQGHYGFGGFMNGAQDLQQREWSPDNWKGALQGLSGGNPARYQELVHTYQQDHPSLSSSEYQKGASEAQSKVYSQDVQVNRATMVNSTYAFDTIKTHLTTIHALSEKIDQAPNEKAAIDLNARLLAEVAYIQTQELKMQILLNQQLSQSEADTIADKTETSKFNTLPDH